jgi:hypothetical protein
MKPAKSLVPNLIVAQMVDKIQTRCVNSENGGDGIGGGGGGGYGGQAAKKKIKTSASAAAAVPAVNGCPWIGPIDRLKNHASECDLSRSTVRTFAISVASLSTVTSSRLTKRCVSFAV